VRTSATIWPQRAGRDAELAPAIICETLLHGAHGATDEVQVRVALGEAFLAWQGLEDRSDRTTAPPGRHARAGLRAGRPPAAPVAPEYETLGGLAMSAIGAVPAVGDRFDLGGWSARVTQMDGRRVELLRVEPPPENTDE
jgi:hypothetical protein